MAKQQITIPVFLPHLGCPHQCIFCNQWGATAQDTIPGASAMKSIVKKYLSTPRKTIKTIELAFFGGTFTGNNIEIQESYLEEAQIFFEKGIIDGIRLSTRPDYINRKIIDLLKRYDVTTVELGVQSFDNRVLSASQRGHGREDVFNAVEMLRKAGISFVIQLMPGLPHDTREISLQSGTMAASLDPSAVRIYPAVVLKNTQMEVMYNDGSYSPFSLEEAVDICSDLYLMFDEKDIPVIRMGIHPMNPEEEDTVIAGPYHPGFGFLVKSRIKRDILENEVKKYLDEFKNTEQILIIIPRINSEEYIGTRKENISYIKKKWSIKNLIYKTENIPKVMIRALK